MTRLPMIAYLLRRLLGSIAVLLAVLTLVFSATHTIGDPADLMLPLNAPPEQREALRESFGLNDPFLVQLGRFIGDVVTGDFGTSLWQGESALALAWSRVPATVSLAAATLVVAVPSAIALAVVAAARRGSAVDRAIVALSLVALAVIDFALALVLILVFAVELGWLPTSGYGGIAFFVLPVATLAVRPFGRILQVTRATVVGELSKPYLVAARAKGIRRRRLLGVHAFRNASVPVASLVGSETIALVNGAIIVETVFGWPGIGYLLIQAIQNRDLPLIYATVFVTGLLVIGVNLLTEVAYGWLNPRIRR